MEIVAWDMSRELVRLGNSVRMITTALPDRRGEFMQDGVHVVPLQNIPSGCYSRAWWGASRAYFEQHCLTSTDAVLSVSAAAFGLLTVKPKLKDVPFIMQAHGTSWGEIVSKWHTGRLRSMVGSLRNLYWMPKDLWAYRHLDAIVAVGQRVYRDLEKAPSCWGWHSSKLHLINNGIDTGLFYPEPDAGADLRASVGIGAGAPLIISASRLHNQKGVQHGIRSFDKLVSQVPDAHYLIAGDGPERQALESLVRQLKLTDRVHFLGALDRGTLARWLQVSDLFLFLTEHVEGLALNVLEALACGLPVIMSEHLQVIAPKATVLANPRDLDTNAHLMARVIRNASQRSRSSRLPTNFSLSHSVSQYIYLINRLRSGG
ncbi:glycosyltransferase family 4 protein [Alcaligenaceae bacterium]|nr:glycosyltransferase family 4 protein [Alcaligenaceae bacterium]